MEIIQNHFGLERDKSPNNQAIMLITQGAKGTKYIQNALPQLSKSHFISLDYFWGGGVGDKIESQVF